MGNLRKKLNNYHDPYKTSDTLNFEGGKSWNKTDKEYFIQLMNTGGIFNTFYMDEKTVIEKSLESIKKFVKGNSAEAAKIASDARNNGFMRTLPIMAVAELSNYDSDVFAKAFDEIIRTPRDLIDVIDVIKSSRGLGRKIKKSINRYINNRLNEFYAMKYGSQLKIAARLGHPKIENNDLMKYIFGNEVDLSKYPQLQALEALKKGNIDPATAINNHRLEMQTVVGIRKPNEAEWEAIASQMSTLQFVKNLAALERHIGGRKVGKLIPKHLSVDNLKKGKVLPFRLLQAWREIQDPFTKNKLATIVNDYPKHYDWSKLGRVCIAPDVSGSMTNEVSCGGVDHKGNYRKIKASLPAGMLTGIMKVGIGDNAFVLPWDNEVYPTMFDHGMSVIDIAHRIEWAHGGGTFMELPVRYLISKDIKVDSFILVTDNEEWGEGWLNDWKKYKQVNPKAKAYLIRVDMYDTNPFSTEDAKRYNIKQIYGWNDNVFKILLE